MTTKTMEVTASTNGTDEFFDVQTAKATLEKAAAENLRLGQEEINEVLQRRKLGILGLPFYTQDGRTQVEVRIVSQE